MIKPTSDSGLSVLLWALNTSTSWNENVLNISVEWTNGRGQIFYSPRLTLVECSCGWSKSITWQILPIMMAIKAPEIPKLPGLEKENCRSRNWRMFMLFCGVFQQLGGCCSNNCPWCPQNWEINGPSSFRHCQSISICKQSNSFESIIGKKIDDKLLWMVLYIMIKQWLAYIRNLKLGGSEFFFLLKGKVKWILIGHYTSLGQTEHMREASKIMLSQKGKYIKPR